MTDEDESTKLVMADAGVGVDAVKGSEGMVMTEFLVSTGLDQSIHMVRYCPHSILSIQCI